VIGAARRVPRLGGECAEHRPGLLGLLEDPLGRTLTAAARAHLERCAECRADLTDAVLMGVAVARSMADARTATPTADAWPRLRTRIERQRATPRIGRPGSSVMSVALAAGLAIALLIPLGMPVSSRAPMHEAGVDPAAIKAAGHRDAEGEARQLRATILAGKEASSDDDLSRAREELIRREAAPVPEWQVPSRSPLTATAR
jgi:hypothetical protein